MAVEIDVIRCNGCGFCEEACSLEGLAAISLKDGKPQVDGELCVECSACIDVCPADAIFFSLESIDDEEIWPYE
jgi:NAD-dependent dihydropyrimidine dehydrogenase PreA subunit